MAVQDSITKALFGDPDEEVIKAGTLAITRGTGVMAAAAVAVTNIDLIPGGDISDEHKLWASIAIVGLWVILAASDALARGRVTAAELRVSPQTHVFPTPLNGVREELPRAEERGWKVMMLRTYPAKPEKLEYFVVKDDVAEWLSAEKVKLV